MLDSLGVIFKKHFIIFLVVIFLFLGCSFSGNKQNTYSSLGNDKTNDKTLKFNLKEVNIDIVDDEKINGFKNSSGLSLYFKERLEFWCEENSIILSDSNDENAVDISLKMKYRRDIIDKVKTRYKTEIYDIVSGQFYTFELSLNKKENFEKIYVENYMWGKDFFTIKSINLV